jgi:hypothetical protein
MFIHLFVYNIVLQRTIEAGYLQCCCAIASSILGVACNALIFSLSRCILEHSWSGLKSVATSSYPYLQWIIIDMVRHACDELNDISSALNFAQNVLMTAMTLSIKLLLLNITPQSISNLKTIMYTTMRVSINTLSSSNILLLDIVAISSRSLWGCPSQSRPLQK